MCICKAAGKVVFPTGGSTYLFERLMLSGKTDFVVSVAVLAQVEVRTCRAMVNIGNLRKCWGVAPSETMGGMRSMLQNWQAFMENYVRASWIQRWTSQLTFRPLPAWAVWVSSHLNCQCQSLPKVSTFHLNSGLCPLQSWALPLEALIIIKWRMCWAQKRHFTWKSLLHKKIMKNHLFVCAANLGETINQWRKLKEEWPFLLLKTLCKTSLIVDSI